MGRQAEAVVATAPVPAGLRANRPIVALGVQMKRSDIRDDVANPLIGISVRGIPIGDQPSRRRRLAVLDLVEFLSFQWAIEQSTSIDLAAIQLRDEVAALLVPVARASHQKWRLGQILLTKPEDLRHMRTVVDRSNLAQQTVVAVADTLLIQGRAAGPGVERDRHEVPHVRHQRRFGLDIVDLATLADPKLQQTPLVDA